MKPSKLGKLRGLLSVAGLGCLTAAAGVLLGAGAALAAGGVCLLLIDYMTEGDDQR